MPNLPSSSDYFRDRLDETMLPLREAAKLLPSRKMGRKVAVATLYRWSSKGCRGVILESWSCGSARVTSEEAVARFVGRLSRARDPKAVTAHLADRTKALRSKEAEFAGRRLDNLGFGVGRPER